MAQASEGQRAEALLFLDEAVRAKFNELWNEAARLAFEVQRTNEETPGVDVLIAELALEQNETRAMGDAARGALRRQPMCAKAKLLLALQAWILRGQSAGVEAGAAATQLLQEAATDELSNGAVRFFAGDILRAVGRPAEARAQLLGALYRQHAWHSAALITAKLFLAAEEAGTAEKLGSPILAAYSARFGTASTALYHAVRSTGDVDSASSKVRGIFTMQQLGVLSLDPAFASAPDVLVGPAASLPLPYDDLTGSGGEPR